MKKQQILGVLLIFIALAMSCNDDEPTETITPEAGTIAGGPFTFIVDGVADNVSGITHDRTDFAGSNEGWVVTDGQNNILGLPPTIADLENVNFDDAGTGVCLIWFIAFEDDADGLAVGENTANITGSFDLSNSITVNRNEIAGATISGGPFNFVVDGVADNVSGITIDDSNVNGMNTSWIITNEEGGILGLPPTLEAVEGVDFDAAGVGVCFIWHITYQDGLTGLEAGNNTSDISGTFALSNSITVNRNMFGGATITGGPYDFVVDGIVDNVDGITLDDSNVTGMNTGWIITDDQNNILGLPPTLEAVEGVDFDEAGVGVCLIWHIAYQDGLTGLEMGNNVSDVAGVFALSNSITVNRNALTGGSITGGPFDFVVDGIADNVSGITLDDTNVNGPNTGWVITDDQNNILGLPPTLEAVEGVDFDEAGTGVCLIWHVTFGEGVTGLEMGNNVSDVEGIFALSNSITVNRNEMTGGTLEGGPYTFVVDGNPDNVSNITLDDTNVNGPNTGWVITDDQNNILGLPPTLEAVEGVNFDEAGVGTCFIWHITFGEGVTGLAMGNNVSDIDGTFALSNSVTVYRSGAGSLSGGPFEFVVDGIVDNVSGISLDDTDVRGPNTGWVITDDQNNILGTPPSLDAVQGVDFDAAGAGVCFIWHVTFENGTTGLMAGNNVSDIDGNFLLSNSIRVDRNEISGGTISGGPFTFTVDGTPDNVSGITLDDSEVNGPNTGWVITDDQNNILGLPPTLAAVEGVDFDAAGTGVCFIWHITYGENVSGLDAGSNVSQITGSFALSNSIRVTRN